MGIENYVRDQNNEGTTCTNSTEVKPDLGVDQDQQYKVKR